MKTRTRAERTGREYWEKDRKGSSAVAGGVCHQRAQHEDLFTSVRAVHQLMAWLPGLLVWSWYILSP